MVGEKLKRKKRADTQKIFRSVHKCRNQSGHLLLVRGTNNTKKGKGWGGESKTGGGRK